MTYTDLSTDELVIIETYFHQNTAVSIIASSVGGARQTVHNVVTFLRAGHSALDYYRQYKKNKKRCGRKRTELPPDQRTYVEEKVAQGWTPDVIAGRKERTINCSFVASAAARRNHIPRKSLDYRTPLEIFMSYMDVGKLSSLF